MMKSVLLVVMAVAVGVFVLAGPLFAHHAQSVYDREHPVTLPGTVTDYLFTNPHTQIRFDAKDANGNVTSWTADTSSPQRLYRVGWNKTSLKPGDPITVTGAPSKDGRHSMSIMKLVGPDGKVLGLGAE